MRKLSPNALGAHAHRGNNVHPGRIDESTKRAIGHPLAALRERRLKEDLEREKLWTEMLNWNLVGAALEEMAAPS